MGRIWMGLFLLLIYSMIYRQMEGSLNTSDGSTATVKDISVMTGMEALDKVKELYATNFDKVFLEDSTDSYYYKLENSDYYLVFEGMEEDGIHYLIHLYEFVLDEPDTGTGHTVTYGWYAVNKGTGQITLR